MESTAATRMSCRLPPLHTFGVSFMEIADKACTKAQDLNGPLGSMIKKIARIAPLVYALEYQLLAIFFFLDNWILGLEYAVEAISPPSRYAFDKIDEFVQVVKILPGKFDEAVIKYPTMIHQVPLLDCALFRVISCLNFFVSKLTEWGSGNAQEKEILIDMNSNKESRNESTVVEETGDHRIESKNLDYKEDEALTGNVCSKVSKDTYKDVLEKTTKKEENGDRDEGMRTFKDTLEKGSKKEENGGEDEGEMTYKDILLRETKKEENGDQEEAGKTYKDALEKGMKKEDNGDRADKGETTEKKKDNRGNNRAKETRDIGVGKKRKGERGKKKSIENKQDGTKMEEEKWSDSKEVVNGKDVTEMVKGGKDGQE